MNMIKFYSSPIRNSLNPDIMPDDSQLQRQIIHLQTMRELLSQKISRAQQDGMSPKDKFEIINEYHSLNRRNKFLKLLVEHSEKSQATIAANFR